VSSFSEENVFSHLQKTIRSQMNEYADHISGGGCKNFEEYSQCCGIIEGLALTEREILDLQSKYENA
jgi:hypothetical protein